VAWANHGPIEPPLPAEDKARLLKNLVDALRDKDITQHQYEQSIYWINATPCEGVNRQLTARQQMQLERAIAKKQKLKKVTVFALFKREGWAVVFSDASV